MIFDGIGPSSFTLGSGLLDTSLLETCEICFRRSDPYVRLLLEKGRFPRLKRVVIPSSCVLSEESLARVSQNIGHVLEHVALDMNDLGHPKPVLLKAVSGLSELIQAKSQSVKTVDLPAHTSLGNVCFLLGGMLPFGAGAGSPFVQGKTERWDAFRIKFFPSILPANLTYAGHSLVEVIMDYYSVELWMLPQYGPFMSVIDQFHGTGFNRAHKRSLLYALATRYDYQAESQFPGFVLDRFDEMPNLNESHEDLLFKMSASLSWKPNKEEQLKRVMRNLCRASPSPHLRAIRMEDRRMISIFYRDAQYCISQEKNLIPENFWERILRLPISVLEDILSSKHVDILSKNWVKGGRRGSPGRTMSLFVACLRRKRGTFQFGAAVNSILLAHGETLAAHPEELAPVIYRSEFIQLVISSLPLRKQLAKCCRGENLGLLFHPAFLKPLVAAGKLSVFREMLCLSLNFGTADAIPQELKFKAIDACWRAAVELKGGFIPRSLKEQFEESVPQWVLDLKDGKSTFPLQSSNQIQRVRTALESLFGTALRPPEK